MFIIRAVHYRNSYSCLKSPCQLCKSVVLWFALIWPHTTCLPMCLKVCIISQKALMKVGGIKITIRSNIRDRTHINSICFSWSRDVIAFTLSRVLHFVTNSRNKDSITSICLYIWGSPCGKTSAKMQDRFTSNSSHSSVLSHRYFTRRTGNMMQQILFSASAHELRLLGGVRKHRAGWR